MFFYSQNSPSLLDSLSLSLSLSLPPPNLHPVVDKTYLLNWETQWMASSNQCLKHKRSSLNHFFLLIWVFRIQWMATSNIKKKIPFILGSQLNEFSISIRILGFWDLISTILGFHSTILVFSSTSEEYELKWGSEIRDLRFNGIEILFLTSHMCGQLMIRSHWT